MKKATLKTYLITLLVLLLAFATMLTAFACTNPEETPEEDTEESTDTFESLVSNGNFSDYSDSSTTQPYSPNSWSSYTPDGPADRRLTRSQASSILARTTQKTVPLGAMRQTPLAKQRTKRS